MSQFLPFAGFRWVPEPEFTTIDWLAQTDDQEIGYIVECDLDYPEALQDLHNDYPLAPERMTIQREWLSHAQTRIRLHYDMSTTAQSTKLVPTLLNRRKYCTHYSLLRFYIHHGMVLTKIHRVISFRQKAWMKPYIVANQKLRVSAKNEFDKGFFKKMNNAAFGKTVENQKKRTDIRLVTSEQQIRKLTEKPQCINFKIFSENLAAVQLRKPQTRIDKPSTRDSASWNLPNCTCSDSTTISLNGITV
jgi:hypothetical protein